ncbi:MAG: HEPN domain-containing protein [Oscillibacter sp.]|nr:HEPN domain-containing protein [Oscillibacter sp.]
MKQQLDENSIQALIKYRMQRAKETLHEADILISQHCFNAAINRLYYACYYAVIALLVKNDITAQTHQGVKQMFGLHFVATGKIANKYSRFYSQLFNDRISGDYDDFLVFDEEQLNQIRPLAEDFITIVEELV